MVLGTQSLLLCTHTKDFVDTEYRIPDSVPEAFGRHWLAACSPSILAPQSFPSGAGVNVRMGRSSLWDALPETIEMDDLKNRFGRAVTQAVKLHKHRDSNRKHAKINNYCNFVALKDELNFFQASSLPADRCRPKRITRSK
ncbi:hypothetical protein GJ744_008578 [Endocarpon pusillum]|uniref:Uncharacterized protein n=1 Tax=Endocarpon pusillum TaxID=364733 RepID=A0A8H7E374_9EURO|nr:hypothetical protein GJ744_008578 [Endocarpon pusillum]